MRVVTPRITSGNAFRWFDRTRVETRISPHASGFTHLALYTGYFTSNGFHGFNDTIFGEILKSIFVSTRISSAIVTRL